MLSIFKFYLSKLIKKIRIPSVLNSNVNPTSKLEAGTTFISSTMGKHSFCGYDCEVSYTDIGNYTSIANRVIIGGAKHPMERVSMSPAFYKGRDSIKAKFALFDLDFPQRIKIGHDVWIGQGAIILPGVTIGNGSVIGAGTIVTKSIPSYAIAVGNPAKVIRFRFESNIISRLEKSEWWLMPDEELKKYAKDFNNPDKFLKLLNL